MTTQWIMEDEESSQDLLALYREARDYVDRKLPRAREQQAKWLQGKGDKFYVDVWLESHRIMFDLQQDLADD